MKNGELEQCGYPNAVINLSFGDGLCLYSPFVMILGMLYYWVYPIYLHFNPQHAPGISHLQVNMSLIYTIWIIALQ